MHLERVLKIPVADQVEQGSECFFFHDGVIVSGCGEAGGHVAAAGIVGAGERLAAVDDGSTFGFQAINAFQHRLHGVTIDEWTH